MLAQRRYAALYGEMLVETGVSDADPSQLVLMLFDGLLDSLSVAAGHMERNAIAEKSAQLGRAGRIVLGLLNALDFEKGGEIARNLAELYGYLTKRILHVNLHNDREALKEIHGLVEQIRDAWRQVPSLAKPAGQIRQVFTNVFSPKAA
jgi:flagellar protein FliS